MERRFYERLVGLTKAALKAVIGRRLLPLEELKTLVKEIEAVLNSRPITYVTSDLDFLPLRPVDFLRPHAALSLPRLKDSAESDDPDWLPQNTLHSTLAEQWLRLDAYLQHFWKRWTSEYLTALRERYQREHRHGRLVNSSPARIGDVVLIAEEGLDRGQWKVAMICGSKDNLLRSATVRHPSGGTITRPLSLLYKLEINNNEDATPSADQVSSPMTTRPQCTTPSPQQHPMLTRSRARTTLPTAAVTLLALLTLLSPCAALTTRPVIDTRCPEESTVRTSLLYVTPCAPSGIGIALVHATKTGVNSLCWTRLQCPSGHLQPLAKNRSVNTNYCGPTCTCLPWTNKCSHYNGALRNKSSLKYLPSDLRDYVPSDVCAFNSSTQCASTPRFGFFDQIVLFDGTVLVVKELTVATNDLITIDDFRCFSNKGSETTPPPNAAVTGTPQYCLYHDCVAPSASTAFCFFGEKVTSYVFHDLRIPIASWGTARRSYYPHPPAPLTSSEAPPAECIRRGLSLRNRPAHLSLQMCTQAICTFINDSRSISSTINLPDNIVALPYQVQITTCQKCSLGKDFTLNCPAAPLCSSVDCKMCLQFFHNYVCWSVLDYIIVGGCLVVAGYVASLLHLLYFIFLTGKAIARLAIRLLALFGRVLRAIMCFPTSCLRGRRAARPARPDLRARYRALFALAIGASLTATAHGCAEVTSISVKQHACVQTDSTVECTVSDSTVLSLRPIGLETCLVMKNADDQVVGTLRLRVNSIKHICDRQTMFFTRAHEMYSNSQHVCGDISKPGSCDDIDCGAIKTDTSLPFFADHQKMPGFNFCATSCGCATCGCLSCSPSCVFYFFLSPHARHPKLSTRHSAAHSGTLASACKPPSRTTKTTKSTTSYSSPEPQQGETMSPSLSSRRLPASRR